MFSTPILARETRERSARGFTLSTVITLRATVRDISSADPSDPRWDPDAGDITNATVSFVNRDTGAVLCTSQVGEMFAGNTDVGSAQCDWLATDANEFTLGVVVGGYYTRDDAADDAAVVVALPDSGPMTASGEYDEFPAEVLGTFAADATERFWYSVSVGAQPNSLALSGNSELRFTSAGTNYELRIVDYISRGATADGPAEFIATAEIWQVRNQGPATVVLADLDVVFKMTDNGNPPGNDTSSWTVWDEGILVLGTGWDGLAFNQLVADGNHRVNI